MACSTRPSAGSAPSGTSRMRLWWRSSVTPSCRERQSGMRAGGHPSSTQSILQMRETAGMIDLTPFAIFDIVGPGALGVVQTCAVRQMDVAIGKVIYTPVLTPGGAGSAPT